MRSAEIGVRSGGGLARLAIALAVVCAAAPLARGHTALEADLAAVPPAVFFIEKITVEGTRQASPDLIVAESLLRAGQSYTETALRQGVYRVRRLPFVRAARFSLRKGSERGSFELVITIEETHRVFFGAESFLVEGEDWALGGVGTVGARAFVGAHGVAFVALQGDQVRVGYTYYNLLNRRAFASLELGHSDDCCEGLIYDHVFGGPDLDLRPPDTDSVALTLGFPVARNQSVRASFLASEADSFGIATTLTPEGEVLQERFPADQRRRQVELAWVLDTTDDPVVPSQGTLASVSAIGRTTQGDSRFFQGVTRSQEELVAGVASVRHYWPLSTRQSLALAGSLAIARIDNEIEACCLPFTQRFASDFVSESTTVDLGYSASLWSYEQSRRLGDLRFEARLSPLLASHDGFEDSTFFTNLEAGLVFRNAWGIFRFRIFYHLEEG